MTKNAVTAPAAKQVQYSTENTCSALRNIFSIGARATVAAKMYRLRKAAATMKPQKRMASLPIIVVMHQSYRAAGEGGERA